jgi:hypothetical protein
LKDKDAGMKKGYKYFFLLILPVLLFYLSRLTNKSFGIFFLSTIDPEYAYLFNGLCVAQLKFDLGHFQHPGTPLQCIIAITSILVHIGNRGLTLAEDVFVNPEHFLHASNIALNILNALLLFIIGYFIYQRSRNIILALLLQVSPFANQLVLETMGRVIPESLLGIASLLLALIVFFYITRTNSNITSTKYIILFSLVSGYGLAIKLTYIPLIIIPLILIASFMDKLKYLLFTIISFFIFAFPLLGKLNDFWTWVKNLFIYSGNYGTGESNIIDISSFTGNIKLLICEDKLLFGLLSGFILVILLYFIKPLKLKLKNDIEYKALVCIALAILIQYLIVAKHYAPTYMVPAFSLFVFGIYLATNILSRIFSKFQITSIIKNILFLAFTLSIFVGTYRKVILYNQVRKQKVEIWTQTLHFIHDNIKDKTVLLVPGFYGAAYVERGLVEGLFYTGKYKATYSKLLQKHYPHTYFYLPFHNRYFDWRLIWDNGLDLKEFIKNNEEIYIYFSTDDINLANKIYSDLLSYCPPNTMEPVRIYYNNETKESIYRFR